MDSGPHVAPHLNKHQHGADENQTANRNIFQNTANACSVYLAPSSVPGGGMGMFTTKPVKAKGSIILPSDGPSIPIIDPDFSQRSRDAWVNLFTDYWWESGATVSALYEADKAVESHGRFAEFTCLSE